MGGNSGGGGNGNHDVPNQPPIHVVQSVPKKKKESAASKFRKRELKKNIDYVEGGRKLKPSPIIASLLDKPDQPHEYYTPVDSKSLYIEASSRGVSEKEYKDVVKVNEMKRSVQKKHLSQSEFETYYPNMNRGASDGDGPSDAKVVTRTAKSVEQPKVKSQMDNKDVKSKMIVAKGPTNVELTEEERLINIKRKGRKRTTLTNITGADKLTLSNRVLLS